MRTFDEILGIAATRKGGREAVLNDTRAPLSPQALADVPDDRWLAQMARCIFQSGISWQVVDRKWPEIEAAFGGFSVGRTALLSDDDVDALLRDPRIIRSAPKVLAIRHNAAWMQEVAAEHGAFARRVADWPAQDFAGLLDWLKTSGQRLGGNTGAYVLRFVGRDGFILSRDVVARLQAEGVIDRAPTSKKAMAAVQAAFNTWAEQSGLPLTTISRVLAQSIDG